MAIVEVNGVRLFYTLSGAETAPVVMLSNSLGTALAMWQPQMAALESEWRVLRYDMRGHGHSEVKLQACSTATLGQDVLALLDALEIENVHFCGLSIGGVIGQWLGAEAPERLRSLVLCNTAAKIGTAETWNRRIADVERGGMAPIADAVLERWFTPQFRTKHPEAVARMHAMVLTTDPHGYALLCAAIRDMDQRTLVEAIRVPTCIVAGEHDPVTTLDDARFLQSRIVGARLTSLSAAHISNVEAQDAFNATLIDFLRGVDESPE